MDQRNFSDTLQYAINRNREQEIRDILTAVYEALVEKGYNPISQ
ncbi:MAG: IreB family regulatory phosphoprotein, partial [Clostridia bacterium]|nr:IreB family regulatory phosphoprotein [Clostridia bacterium]